MTSRWTPALATDCWQPAQWAPPGSSCTRLFASAGSAWTWAPGLRRSQSGCTDTNGMPAWSQRGICQTHTHTHITRSKEIDSAWWVVEARKKVWQRGIQSVVKKNPRAWWGWMLNPTWRVERAKEDEKESERAQIAFRNIHHFFPHVLPCAPLQHAHCTVAVISQIKIAVSQTEVHVRQTASRSALRNRPKQASFNASYYAWTLIISHTSNYETWKHGENCPLGRK